MRRGLMSWSREEEPDEIFKARFFAVQAAMKEGGYDALLIYTDFTRPSAVSRLTHFIPYWNRGVLIVLSDQPSSLICALSNRVAGWIRETSLLEDVLCTQDLAGGIASKLKDGGIIAGSRVGIVDINSFPRGVLNDITTKISIPLNEDATELFETAMAAAPGPSLLVIENALAVGEAAISAARDTFKSVEHGPAMIAAAELAARNAGAEEVLIAVAPDAEADPRIRRIEGQTVFGNKVFLRLSIAYKGYWHRIGTTLEIKADSLTAGSRAEISLRDIAHKAFEFTDIENIISAVAKKYGAEILEWSVEGARGGNPLFKYVGKGQSIDLKPKGLSTLTVRLSFPNGQWFLAFPMVFN